MSQQERPIAAGRREQKTGSVGAEVELPPPRQRGKTFIEDDVISVIARSAAEQSPGVHQIGESSLRTMLSRFGRHHGVQAETGLEEAAADIEVIAEMGYSIRDMAEEIRERVIETVEAMTGRKVIEVNIFVVDIFVPRVAGRRPRRELE